MPWTQIEPGHFQRPIGENERFIKAIGDRAHGMGHEHWSITAYATFALHRRSSSGEVEDEETAWLRRAWKALRFQHPSIASVANEDTLDYIVPTAQELEDWVQETLIVVEDKTQTVDDVIASLRPSRYVTGHYLADKSQFIIHLAHWRTDGYGALQLLNAFFEACSATSTSTSTSTQDLQVHWGSETSRLVPSVEEALGNPAEATKEIQTAAGKYLSTIALMPGSVGVSQSPVPVPVPVPVQEKDTPAGTRSAHLRLAEKTTEKIRKACDAHNISVLAAVHASTAAATYAFATADSRGKPYTSTIRFSLRPYLPKPYDNASVAAGLYTGGYMFQVPASGSWLENARRYHAEYENGVTREFLDSRREYARCVFGRMAASVSTAGAGALPSEVDISSVDAGLVEPWHGGSAGDRIEVVRVSVGVEALTRQMYCFVWTFRGCLELSIVYNEAFYEEGFVRKVVEAVARILQSELGVSTSI